MRGYCLLACLLLCCVLRVGFRIFFKSRHAGYARLAVGLCAPKYCIYTPYRIGVRAYVGKARTQDPCAKAKHYYKDHNNSASLSLVRPLHLCYHTVVCVRVILCLPVYCCVFCVCFLPELFVFELFHIFVFACVACMYACVACCV